MRGRSLIIIFTAILVCSACVKYQPARVGAVTGRRPLQSAAADSLSQHIRSVLKIAQENTTGMAEALEQLHRERPELATLNRQAAANHADMESRRILAKAYVEERLYAPALTLCEEILRTDPADSAANLDLAIIWDEWGDYASAREHAERAAPLAQNKEPALELLGRICLHQKDFDAALKSFQAVLQISPENPRAQANIGYLFMLRAEWENSREYLQNAIKMDGSIAEAHNHLGIVLARLGDRTGALAQFAAVNPPAPAFNNLGAVYLAQDRLFEARAEFQHALELQPDYTKAQVNLRDVEARLPPPTVFNLRPFDEAGRVNHMRPANLIEVDFALPRSLALLEMRPPLSNLFTVPRGQAATEWMAAREYNVPSSDPSKGSPASGSGELAAKNPEPNTARAAQRTAQLPIEAETAHKLSSETPSNQAKTESLPRPHQTFAIQVCAARTESNARMEGSKLANASLAADLSQVDLLEKGIWYRLRLAGYSSARAARDAGARLVASGLIRDFWVVKASQ